MPAGAIPDASPALVPLLKDIGNLEAPLSSGSSQALFSETLARGFALCDDASHVQSGLEALRAWARKALSLLQANAGDGESLNVISARLDQPTQLNFINLVWAYINAERPTIAAQAKALFISLLDFLDKVSSLARTSQPSASTKTLPLLGSDLLARSLAALERKKSLVLLELLVVRYGSEPVLGAQPELYRLLLDGLDSIDGGAGRRGKIALMLLKSSARHVGVNEKELEKTPVDVWAKWCKSWQGPLVDALRSDNERRRQQIAAYFLAGLFDYAPPTFQAVIFSLLDTPVEPETSDQADNNLRAVLVVLRTGKLRGLCRVGDTALEAESENHVLLGSATEEQTYSTISKPLQTIVPTPLLTACAISSSTEAQLAALGLVAEARLVSSPLSSADYAVLRTFFTYNMTITSAEVRGQVNGIFIKLLTRLRTSSYAAARDAARLEGIEAHERTAEEAARLVELQGAVEDVRSFFQWFYTLICRATHPGASYQHVVSALTFLELLLSTGVDPRFTVTASSTGLKPGKGALSKNLSTFSQAYPFALDLVTPALTLRLLACFDSTFDDIQRRALALLCRFPSPLPGLETREVAERLILRKAARLLLSTRDSESSAAASLIQLYQHSYVSALGWRATSLLSLSSAPSNGTTQGDASPSSQPSEQLALLSLLHDLLSFLSAQLAVAESGNLLAAAASHPLHGVLTTLQQLCSSLDLTRAPLNAHLDEIRTIYQRALTLIDRTWEVTRGVLCHVAPEGSTGQEAVGDQEEDADGFDDPLPDEESARAMQVAGEEDGQGEAALAGPKHQVILSYSWRGMKEASALLGVLVSSSLRQGPGTARGLWRYDELCLVGERFNGWLTYVRHRGAFSTIYPAYSTAAAAIIRSNWSEIENLPHSWINTFLVAIASAQLSTTRRSAGIGYAVLALVGAHPNKQDASVLNETVQRLVAIAADDKSESKARIHALNVVRVLVLDGALSEVMAPFVGELLTLTIRCFSSTEWGVRNVAMMLFAALCSRAFSSRRTNSDKRTARMPFHEFFARYGSLQTFLLEQLSDAVRSDLDKMPSSDLHSSLFAVLMIFSRLQALDIDELHQHDRALFIPLIERCAESQIWKVREIAARAYGSVVPPREAFTASRQLLERCDLRNQNGLHGRLLQIRRLIISAFDSASSPLGALELDAALREKTSTLLIQNRCPATCAAFLEVVLAFAKVAVHIKQSPPYSDAAPVSTFAVVQAWVDQRLATTNELPSQDALAQLLQEPCEPALLALCARTSLDPVMNKPVPETPLALLNHSCEDVRLEALQSLEGLGPLDQLSQDGQRKVCIKLHELVRQADEGIWVRVKAAEVLQDGWSSVAARLQCIQQSLVARGGKGDEQHLDLQDECFALSQIALTTACVPLREAVLPYFGTLVSLALDRYVAHEWVSQTVGSWCMILSLCGDESESIQSRYATVRSLRAVSNHLFPESRDEATDLRSPVERSLFEARILAIRLLADDDEDQRDEAAALVGETAGRVGLGVESDVQTSSRTSLTSLIRIAKRGSATSDVSTDRAWAWMSWYYGLAETQAANQQEYTLWEDFVSKQLQPSEEDLDQAFEDAFHPSSRLFATERPNQYRDEEADIRRAYSTLYEASSGRKHQAASVQKRATALCGTVERLAEALGIATERASASESTATSRNAVATHLLSLRVLLAAKVVRRQIDSASRTAGSADVAASLFTMQERLRQMFSNVRDALDLDLEDGETGEASTASSADSLSGPALSAAAPGSSSDGPTQASKDNRYRIAMVSDFFFPNVGGVEGHIYMVGQRLIERGHKVIVITHAYKPDRVGVRYLSSGLKVYYVPYGVIARQDTLPNFFSLLPILRSILLRERIQIVHGHQALSSMCHEGILHARNIGIKAVFTDHSLFGFADTASILTNKLLKFALSDVDHVVCVSHTGKENTVLRAALDPRKVSVIPNAVVASQFRPDTSRVDPSRLTIVVLSRLMYRKGIDLLIAAIPRICALHPEVDFVIGGDGPKRVELEQMREKHMLQDRVELVGAVRQGDVRNHLIRGQIFLNTSLTEAFGTGIIEAACAGLFVVSTRVGGVPEVLPPSMVQLAKPDEDDVIRAVEAALAHLRAGKHDPVAYHEAVKGMYSWSDVAARLERVYAGIIDAPMPDSLERFEKYYAGGLIAGKIFCIIVAVDMLFLFLLEWLYPKDQIDVVPDLQDRGRDTDSA